MNRIKLTYAMKKLVVSQGMKAVKPWVIMIRMLKNNPYHAKYGWSTALYGRESREMPREARTFMKRIWQPLMHAQLIKPATDDILRNQLNTVPPLSERFRKASRPKAAVTTTA